MIGQTKDAGFQIGVSTTLPWPIEQVWDLLTSPAGVALWLGDGARLGTAKGDSYRTDSGTVGELRSRRERDRVRLTWRPAGWDHDTTLQVAVVAKDARTMLRFHQERLSGPAERARQRAHWRGVVAAIENALSATSPARTPPAR